MTSTTTGTALVQQQITATEAQHFLDRTQAIFAAMTADIPDSAITLNRGYARLALSVNAGQGFGLALARLTAALAKVNIHRGISAEFDQHLADVNARVAVLLRLNTVVF